MTNIIFGQSNHILDMTEIRFQLRRRPTTIIP